MSDESSKGEPNVSERAAEWIRRLQHADIDTSQLCENHPLARRSPQTSADLLHPLGEPLQLDYLDSAPSKPNGARHRFRVCFRSGNALFIMGILANGKVNQLSVKPMPGEPSPFHELRPGSELHARYLTPRPGETPEAAMLRGWPDLLTEYTHRIESAPPAP